jgi:metal-sulfur cluster biosynthetic enzyme
MISEKQVYDRLRKVIDPELGIDIVDLGLIYGVKVEKKGKVEVVMTFTTAACPLAPVIQEQVVEQVGQLNGVAEVKVEVTFDPPWTQEMMGKKAKAELGFD